MALYFATGSASTELSDQDLRKALFDVYESLGTRDRVLALPPDFTRFNSRAGQLTCMTYELSLIHI